MDAKWILVFLVGVCMVLHISNAEVDGESFYQVAEFENGQAQKRSEYSSLTIDLNFFLKFMEAYGYVSLQLFFAKQPKEDIQKERKKNFWPAW